MDTMSSKLSMKKKQQLADYKHYETTLNTNANSNGYVKNIQEQLVCKLKDMEQTERPIHCTDTKRKQFYVKDVDCWNK